nr:site-specific integrase [uncultured Acetatifactor sp.]
MARGENVFRRKDGRYEARYIKGRRADGKPVYGFCYGRTYEEAKGKADRAREEMASAKRPDHSQGPDVACFCDSWLSANSTRLKPSSAAKYRMDMENHIKPYFEGKLPCEVRPEEIEGFTRMLLNGKGLSPKTVRSILTLLRSVLSYMRKQSGENLPELEIAYPKECRKNARVLDKKEEAMLAMLLAQEMDSCKFGVYLALRTGMRIGEVCALRWRDISFESAAISVCQTVLRLPQKQTDSETFRKDGFRTALVVGPPKSESSLRVIPLMPDIAALCERFRPEDPEAFLLTGTARCMGPRKLQRRLKRYLEECGIPEAHFHTLRHTFATRCVEAGFDVKTLSDILGHSNIGITMNLYVHPNLDLKRENMSRLKPMISL